MIVLGIYTLTHRGKYLSLFPVLVQGKVLNFELFGEEFWGLKAIKRKNLEFQQIFDKYFREIYKKYVAAS